MTSYNFGVLNFNNFLHFQFQNNLKIKLLLSFNSPKLKLIFLKTFNYPGNFISI